MVEVHFTLRRRCFLIDLVLDEKLLWMCKNFLTKAEILQCIRLILDLYTLNIKIISNSKYDISKVTHTKRNLSRISLRFKFIVNQEMEG